MDDLAELKRRVDNAVDHLAVAQDSRRQQQEALVQLLADLEVKFDARHEELVYCHARIADLEQANEQLAHLLNTVIDLIELGSNQDANDPIFQASKMASELIRLCDAGLDVIEAGREEAPKRAGPSDLPSAPPRSETMSAHERFFSRPAPTPSSPPIPERGAAPAAADPPPKPLVTDAAFGESTFVDVSDEELEVETLLDDMLDDDNMPGSLTRALSAAKDRNPDDLAHREPLDRLTSAVEAARVARGAPRSSSSYDEPSDAELMDIPGIETAVAIDVPDVSETASMAAEQGSGACAEEEPDIKALLRRIQEAAEKARARAEAPSYPSDTPDRTGTS